MVSHHGKFTSFIFLGVRVFLNGYFSYLESKLLEGSDQYFFE